MGFVDRRNICGYNGKKFKNKAITQKKPEERENRMKLLQFLLNAIKGAIVGVGAILPGVSGGVLCVVFGIYEPMMELLTNPAGSLKKHRNMFVPFALGWAVGFVLLARVMEVFFTASPDVAVMLFFGLVCGTIPSMMKKSELADREMGWTPFVISLAASYLFFHILESGSAMNVPANFWSFLFCGFMWGLSLIVPGLSSSTVLILLGLYVPLADGIAGFDVSVLIPFGIGIGVTALLLAKLVDMLFKNHYALVSRIILGFVISSSLKTLPDAFGSVRSMVISLICLVAGFAAAIAMEKSEGKGEG